MYKKLSEYRLTFLLAFLCIIILLALFANRTYMYANKFLKTPTQELQCDDTFPEKVILFAASGKKAHLSDIKADNRVLFYLDSAKPDCITRLKSISKIIKLFKSTNISYTILWYKEIPTTKIKEHGIDLNINYSFKNKYAPSQSTPTAYVVDNKGKVILLSGYDYYSLITKVNEISGNKDMRQKVNEMVISDALSNKTGQVRNNEANLLMFITSGCRLCQKSDLIIKDNISLLQSKFNTISVRPDFGDKPGYDFNMVIDDSLVYFNIYNNFYDVTYPVFVILNKKLEVERIFTDIKELIDYAHNI